MKLFEIVGGAKSSDSGRTSVYSAAKFAEYLKMACTFSWVKVQNSPIYRGSTFGHQFGFGTTNMSKPRMSKNTRNYYTLWIDNSPKWEFFPKRSTSFICSTDRYYASEFSSTGSVSVVIPYDNAVVGVCPEYDIWESFALPDGIMSLSELNNAAEQMWDLLVAAGEATGELSETNAALLRKQFSQITRKTIFSILSRVDSGDITDVEVVRLAVFVKRALTIFDSGADIAQVFDNILTPGSRFKSYRGAKFIAPAEREVFVESQCLFIDADIFNTMSESERAIIEPLFDKSKPLYKQLTS